MTVTIGGQEYLTTQEVEDGIKLAGFEGVQAQKVRLAAQREVFQARLAEARAKHPGVSAGVGSAVSTGLNYGNQALFGFPGKAAAAVTAPITAARRGVSLSDAFELNEQTVDMALGASPRAQLAGTLGAYLAPTPANVVSRAGFAAGGSRLANIAASSPSAARSAIAQIAASFAGGATSIAATQGAQGLVDGRDAAEVVQDSLGIALSPTNLALSGAGGALAALSRTRPDPAQVRLVERARRLFPGFEPTPDMLRPEGGFLSGFIDTMKHSAAGRRAITRYLSERVYQPLSAAVTRIRDRTMPRGAARGDLTSRAAGDIRGMIVNAEGEIGRGRIGRAIESAGKAGFSASAAAGERVSRHHAATILNSIRALDRRARAARGTEGPRGGELGTVIRDMRTMFREAGRQFHRTGEWDVTPQMLDNLRQRIAPIAKFEAGRSAAQPVLSARDIRDAKVIYRVLREAERASSSHVDTALNSIAALRRVERHLRPIAGNASTADDITLVRSMFTAKDFDRRWQDAERLMRPEQVQRLRGAYLAEFLEEITMRRSVSGGDDFLLNLDKMDDLLHGKGPAQFRRSVFDRVLPGARRDIWELAEFSDMVKRTAGRAVGSQTAPRAADAALVMGAAGTLGMAVDYITDPSPGVAKKLVGSLLGVPGVFAFASSMLNGRLANALNRAASGGVLMPNQQINAAAAQVGGLEGFVNTGLGGQPLQQ